MPWLTLHITIVSVYPVLLYTLWEHQCSLLGPGDDAVLFPRPGQTGRPVGPYSEDRHPVYPQRFNWFESTPKDASQLDRDLNQQSVLLVNYIVHTHVMSNV